MRPSLFSVAPHAALLTLALTCLPGTAGAQQPSQEQQDAIRSSCRSDFLSLCSGVPRGGKEAFDCLKQNTAKLSASCRTAVSAVAPPAPPPAQAVAPAAPPPPPAASAPVPAPAATAPARPAAPPAATAPAPQPSRASAPVPPAPRPTAKPSAPAPATAAAPAAPAPAAPAAPRLSQEEENALVRQSCVLDYRRFCRGVMIGEGRVIACLNNHIGDLMPACGAAIKVVTPR